MKPEPKREQPQTDILLVDDREENLLTLEAALASPRYRLFKATSGDAALRYLLDHEPALILMDVQMPGLDGYETASLIKSSQRTRAIPIIFVTALNLDEHYVHRAYDHGAVDYVYKPFDVHILRSKVSVFVDLAEKTKRLVQAEIVLREAEAKERERQIAQLELTSMRRERAEQNKFRDLVEGLQHGVVWAMNKQTHATSFVSESSERILGSSAAKWSEEPDFFARRVHPNDREGYRQALSRLGPKRREVDFEHRFVRPDGRIVWLHTGIRLSQELDQGDHEIRGLSVDITEMKLAEETLRRHKNRSDFLADASGLLSESLDPANTLDSLAKLAVSRTAGWCAIEVQGSPEQSAISVSTHAWPIHESLIREQRIRFPIPETVREGDPLLIRELNESTLLEFFSPEVAEAVRKEIGAASLMIVPIRIRDRTIGSMTFVSTAANEYYDGADLAMMQDLARRVATCIENANLYHQMRAAVRIRDDFLSIASHELKTPLTPLKLQAQGLRRALLSNPSAGIDPAKITRMLESSDRQINRLSRLIDDLLDISRISSGKLKLNFEPFNLCDLVREITERFEEEIKTARCTLVTDFPSEAEVHWDRFRIEQVVINLLTNALKYGAGSEVRISIRQTPDGIDLSIRDQGIGIAEEDQARVFGRFERAVSGNNFGGLGLGLYIVTQIIEAHGGRIALSSRPGAGSLFSVLLAAQPQLGTAAEARETPGFRPPERSAQTQLGP